MAGGEELEAGEGEVAVEGEGAGAAANVPDVFRDRAVLPVEV